MILKTILHVALAGLFATAICTAETLVLKSGKQVTRKVTGMNSQEVVLSWCGRQEKYARSEITTIQLSSSGPRAGMRSAGDRWNYASSWIGHECSNP